MISGSTTMTAEGMVDSHCTGEAKLDFPELLNRIVDVAKLIYYHTIMNVTVTIRIPFKTKVALEGLATMSRQSIGKVVAQAVDLVLEQLPETQRLTMESLTEQTTMPTNRDVRDVPVS
jgi:hypothetical protein